MEETAVKEIAKICGFSVTNHLGKYLVIPLLHNRVTKARYQEIVDKVEKNYLDGMQYIYLWLGM